MPERSKGFDSSSNVFVLVDSYPTECMKLLLLLQPTGNTILLHPTKLCTQPLYTFTLILRFIYATKCTQVHDFALILILFYVLPQPSATILCWYNSNS